MIISTIVLAIITAVLIFKVSKLENKVSNLKHTDVWLAIQDNNALIYRNLNNLTSKLSKQNQDYIHYKDSAKDAINRINFRLDNPPLYNIGDKVDKDWIVTSVTLISYPKLQYNYSATNIKTGETKTWAE